MNRSLTAVFATTAATVLLAPVALGATTERVSLDSAGGQANTSSGEPAINADGRFVAFTSPASNLVPRDTNAHPDVFVRDRLTGVTERVNVDSGGGQANNTTTSGEPALSAGGRFIVFASFASNLVASDTNANTDVFVRDRQTGVTERVSVGAGGAQANSGSRDPALSADGRLVAFTSLASNLSPGAPSAVLNDIFVRDRQTGMTEWVSMDSAGGEANNSSNQPALSADGRFVAFESFASDLVAGDTNATGDVFVRDLQTGVTERVSVGVAGGQANSLSSEPKLSADGRIVAFESSASNLVAGDTNARQDVFVHDRQTGVTERVSVDGGGAQADNFSVEPALSADGRVVGFMSSASNLVPGDTNLHSDVFVRDRQTGVTERVSVDAAGAQSNSHSSQPALNADARAVAFVSGATTLVPGDTNAAPDVFIREQDPIAVDDAATVLEDSGPNTIAVLANDTGGRRTIASASDPAHGTVAVAGDNLSLTYEPDPDYCNDPPGTATDDFTYALSPGGDTATVAVTVTCVDDHPTATDDAATVAEDSGTNTIAVLADDTDPDGGPMAIASASDPANGTVVLAGDGLSLNYEPDPDYCNNTPGSATDDFTYALSPGGDTATVAVTVTCVDDGPTCDGRVATIVGIPGPTELRGTSGDDVIVDLDGDNVVRGRGGNDTVCTGTGNDEVYLGTGADTVIDTGGPNTVEGGAGNDRLTTGAGGDLIHAGPGADRVDDSGGHNGVEGGAGADTITTGAGDDLIDGGRDADTIDAGDGHNRVNGQAENDTITTGAGDDLIDGGLGFDACAPGAGLNTIRRCETIQ